jgi:hypothetical protein
LVSKKQTKQQLQKKDPLRYSLKAAMENLSNDENLVRVHFVDVFILSDSLPTLPFDS